MVLAVFGEGADFKAPFAVGGIGSRYDPTNTLQRQ